MHYTGERKLVGIAMMHKFNPVIHLQMMMIKLDPKQATEIAQMRRN